MVTAAAVAARTHNNQNPCVHARTHAAQEKEKEKGRKLLYDDGAVERRAALRTGV